MPAFRPRTPPGRQLGLVCGWMAMSPIERNGWKKRRTRSPHQPGYLDEGELDGVYIRKLETAYGTQWYVGADNSFDSLLMDDIEKLAAVPGISDYNVTTKITPVNPVNFMLFERTMLSDTKNKELLTRSGGLVALRDAYVFEFLDVKEPYKEKDLRKSIVANLRDFILEFGQDFTFVGEEYRIQVGNTDFFIDLLFYNRALSCLVAIELKVDKFRPEHLGQLNFYLEALDRDVRKPNENPSVGLILCTSKDDTVVEYALSRSMSPTMVAYYTLHLPDKTLLENRLRELTQALTLESGDAE